jgi:hypothetical protein
LKGVPKAVAHEDIFVGRMFLEDTFAKFAFQESLLPVRAVVDHGAVLRPAKAVIDFAYSSERHG